MTRFARSSPTRTDARCAAVAYARTSATAAGCAEFAAAIATRSADLRALSPALPATAAAAVLARSLGAGSGHSGGGAAGLAAGTAGKTARRRARHQGRSRRGDRRGGYRRRRGRTRSDRGKLTLASAQARRRPGWRARPVTRRPPPESDHQPRAGHDAAGPANKRQAEPARPTTGGERPKVTRLAGISTPAIGGHGAKTAAGSTGERRQHGSITSPQQAPATTGRLAQRTAAPRRPAATRDARRAAPGRAP